MGQDGAGAGEGAKLGGGQETLGGVLNGIEDGRDAGEAVFEAGVGVEGSLAGVGIVMLGEAAHGGAGHDEDGDKEVKEGGAIAGGGGLDVLSEEFEDGHRGDGVGSGLGGGGGLGWGLSHGNGLGNSECKRQKAKCGMGNAEY